MTASIKRSLLVLAVAAMLLGSAATTFAGAPTLVPDYRGAPNSVHAIFNWMYGDVQVIGGEPNFDDSYWETTVFETGGGSYPLDPTTPGAFDDGLNTTVDLPNFIDELPVKHMRVVMRFDGEVDLELLIQSINVSASDPEGTPSWGIVGAGMDYEQFATYYVDIDIEPNPDSETIAILGDVGANIVPGNLLQIEVDTVSVPEPMTMSLLAAGGLAILRRRSKIRRGGRK